MITAGFFKKRNGGEIDLKKPRKTKPDGFQIIHGSGYRIESRVKKLYAFSLKVSEAIWWYLQMTQRGKKDHLHIYFLTHFSQEY